MDLRKTLDDAVSLHFTSKLPDGGSIDMLDLTGHSVRNIVNNICANDDIKYLEIGLYRGGIFSSALYQNKIRAVGIDDWSQNWGPNDPQKVFNDRISGLKKDSHIDIINSDCWAEGLLGDEKFNVYTFDGPHGWQDQYDGLCKYIQNMHDIFIYIVDDYDNKKSPEVVDAVQSSIKDLKLNILSEHTMPAGYGYHEGVYFSCLEKS
mgnify:CR=1 FL=1|jgi:hypothetical protein